MTHYACTLFEKNYHLGVAVLINSLYHNGFRGTVCVGYRGELPPWASATNPQGELALAPDLQVRFFPIAGNRHLTNEKSAFLQKLLRDVVPTGASLFYFDPDVLLRGNWAQLEQWVTDGPLLVEDCTYPYLPSTHPLRYRWLACAAELGLTPKQTLSRYYNAGAIGVTHRDLPLLETWERLLQHSVQHGYDITRFPRADRGALWSAADQDHLNLALMVTDTPLVTLGPDGMDFAPGGYVFSHGVGSKKPWTTRYLRCALIGEPPTPTDKLYWQHAQGVLQPFSPDHVRKTRLALRLGLVLGRFIRRPTM